MLILEGGKVVQSEFYAPIKETDLGSRESPCLLIPCKINILFKTTYRTQI